MIPRIAFMGTPEFAAYILEALLNQPYQLVAVYTQPPRAKGRGYALTQSPVHTLAALHNIPVFTPTSLKTEEAQNQWASLELDVAIVAAYGLILPKAILEAPHKGCLNVHASLLPRWRGAAPIQRAILAGDRETGVTIMKMDVGLDTGDMLLTERVPLDDNTTTPSLLDGLAEAGARALLKALPPYLAGTLAPAPQPEQGVTYAEKLKKEEGLLDWTLPAVLLERKVRALNPWPGTWFTVGEDRIKVLEATALPTPSPHPPGTIIDDQLTIACGMGALRPVWVQKVGKSPLLTADFLRGYELPPILSHETL
jgi:methionyl-tRNA formyltransferase